MSEDRIEAFYIKQAMARREANKGNLREIYCCTICKRVQAPTEGRNIRCKFCKAPLLQSLERITDLRRSVKRHYDDPKAIEYIQSKIILIRSMRAQYADLNKFGKKDRGEYVRRKKEQRTVEEIMRKTKEVKMVFKVIDPEGQVYKLQLDNKKDIEAMYKQAGKIRGKVEYQGTVREVAVMESIRKVIIDVKKAAKKE